MGRRLSNQLLTAELIKMGLRSGSIEVGGKSVLARRR